MDDLDIYRSANVMLMKHGRDTAWQHAMRRIAETAGDPAGQVTWLRILDAIEELTRAKLDDGEALH